VIAKKMCEQCSESQAVVYAGGKSANDWAGFYCLPCKEKLGFIVFDNHPNGVVQIQIADIDCPDCRVQRGQWCERHGQVLGGNLLACVGRSREVLRLNKIASTTVDTQNDEGNNNE